MAEARSWLWSEGVEGEISDTDETRITLTAHEALWARFMTKWRAECVRLRVCYGCIYLGVAGTSLCCSHYLDTGKRRNCPCDGTPCPAKKVYPGWKPTPEYERFLRDTEKTVQARNTEKTVRARKTPPEKERKRRRISWDYEYAYGLYQRGIAVSQISEIMGVSKNTVNNHARTEGWKTGTKNVFPKKIDLGPEIEAYRRHRAQKEAEAENQTG